MSDVNVSVAEVQENPGWVKFISVLMLIYGILLCLTIIGALIGVPIIFASTHLKKAAADAQSFKESNLNEMSTSSMVSFLKAFKIFGILGIVYLAFMVIYIASLPAIFAAAGGLEAFF